MDTYNKEIMIDGCLGRMNLFWQVAVHLTNPKIIRIVFNWQRKHYYSGARNENTGMHVFHVFALYSILEKVTN